MSKTISDIEAIIVIIVFVILVGGIMAWQFLWVPKEEAKIAKESAEEYMRRAEEEAVKAEEFIKKGDDYSAVSFISNAIEFAQKATDLDPDNAEMWFRRGDIYFMFKDLVDGAEKWASICYKKGKEIKDMVIKADLSSLRGIAELYAWNENNGSYLGFCNSRDVLVSQAIIEKESTMECADTAETWIACAQLKENPTDSFCVDWEGNAKQLINTTCNSAFVATNSKCLW